MNSLSFHPSFPLKFRSKNTRKSFATRSQQQQQKPNISVLRFTFGIPGLDESYLPRWIGYGFGSLLLLNHFVGSNSQVTAAQLRTEALGLSLAAFSTALPYFGRFLKGAGAVDQITLPQGTQQIFVMSRDITVTTKEDLAWATYVLLRNTSTVAVLISVRGDLCIRGYWSTSNNLSKDQVIEWFQSKIAKLGLADLKESLYFPQTAESGLWEMLPKGTCSVLVEPVLQATKEKQKVEGFVLLASSMEYAYNDEDRAWIRAVADKFRDSVLLENIFRDASKYYLLRRVGSSF